MCGITAAARSKPEPTVGQDRVPVDAAANSDDKARRRTSNTDLDGKVGPRIGADETPAFDQRTGSREVRSRPSVSASDTDAPRESRSTHCTRPRCAPDARALYAAQDLHQVILAVLPSPDVRAWVNDADGQVRRLEAELSEDHATAEFEQALENLLDRLDRFITE